MEGEPRNAAVDLLVTFLESGRVLPPERWSGVLVPMFADDFVAHHRRRIIAMPDMDKATYTAASLLSANEISAMTTYRVETIAKRGDRLALGRGFVGYADGAERVQLMVVQLNKDCEQFERWVRFDPEDVDAALAELDHWSAEINDE